LRVAWRFAAPLIVSALFDRATANATPAAGALQLQPSRSSARRIIEQRSGNDGNAGH
jgi:hypothetical protein